MDFRKNARPDIGATGELDDKDAAALLTGISPGVDKLFWFAEAHLRA